LEAYNKYGFDEKAGKFYGAVKLDGTPIPARVCLPTTSPNNSATISSTLNTSREAISTCGSLTRSAANIQLKPRSAMRLRIG
jgi:hypothetical protein